MRHLVLLFAAVPLLAQSDESAAVAAVQKLFDGMAAHDGAMIRSVALPDAKLYAVHDTGAPTSVSLDDFATRIAGAKGDLLEKFTAKPKVLIRAKMAQVWGEYDFIRDGKFDHCGVDSVSLFKTETGWKVAAIAYTSEVAGCKGH
jgi:hypothetical protein